MEKITVKQYPGMGTNCWLVDSDWKRNGSSGRLGQAATEESALAIAKKHAFIHSCILDLTPEQAEKMKTVKA